MGQENPVKNIEGDQGSADIKQKLLDQLEKMLPEDGNILGALNSLDNTLGSDFIESKHDFIQGISESNLSENSMGVIVALLEKHSNDFYENTHFFEDLKSQIDLHIQLSHIIQENDALSSGSIDDLLKSLMIRGYFTDKSLTLLSEEEIGEMKNILELYKKILIVDTLYTQNQGFLLPHVAEKVLEDIYDVMQNPEKMSILRINIITRTLEESKKIRGLQDMLEVHKGFMPLDMYEGIESVLNKYLETPEDFGTEEFHSISEQINISKQYYNEIKKSVVDNVNIEWGVDLLYINKEPYSSLFSAFTTMYIHTYIESNTQEEQSISAEEILEESKLGISLTRQELSKILKNIALYLVDQKFEKKIFLTLKNGEKIEITSIIAEEQEKIQLKSMKETKKILSVFRFLNNPIFSKNQIQADPTIENIASMLGIENQELIVEIQSLGVMSSVEQSKDFEVVVGELKEIVDQGLISLDEIYSICSAYIKPGSASGLKIVEVLIGQGLLNDSNALQILEGSSGFQENGGISLNDFLKVNGIPTKLKSAISLVFKEKLGIMTVTEEHFDRILIDMLYRNAIESRGGYNIDNDARRKNPAAGSSAAGYVQILTGNGRFDEKTGKRYTNSFETGLKRIPESVLNMYPGLKRFHSEIPRTDKDVISGDKPNPEKQDPKELTAEEQMIWAIADLYSREESSIYIRKILSGDNEGIRKLYANIHHTEGMSDVMTMKAMENHGDPILENQESILAGILRGGNVIESNGSDIQVAENAVVTNPIVQDKEQILPTQEEESIPIQEEKSINVVMNDEGKYEIQSGDTLGKVAFDLIKEMNPNTSFAGSGEIAMKITQGVGDIPLRIGDIIELSRPINGEKNIAYYLKVGKRILIIQADKQVRIVA